MQAWLSGSKNTASATNPSENAMEVDEIVDQTMVSSETEPKNPTMSEQGPNVSNSKNAAPGESTTTSNLYDPLLDDLDLDDISAKLEQAQARAAKAVAGDAQISSRTHRRKASKSS